VSTTAYGRPVVVSTIEIDHATAAQFRAELTRALAEHIRAARSGGEVPASPLVIDLREVTFMDSTGVSIILGVEAALRAERARLELVGVHPAVRRTLEVSGVWDHLHEGPPQD
jgi:stage II sporulation protein AA (anti-sigma F factor antagonist)